MICLFGVVGTANVEQMFKFEIESLFSIWSIIEVSDTAMVMLEKSEKKK